MEPGAKGKSNGAVGLVAVDLIDRMCGGGRRRRSRRKSGSSSSLCGFQHGYSRLESGSNCREHSAACVDLPPIIENVDERCDSSADEEDGEVNERMLLLLNQQQRPRWSLSSDEYSSKRWMSLPTEHYSSHRRRRGYSCMRLRIVNMVRLVAMMRKVRLAYRRMMSAAAASKTILSLADIYNDIADLIPVTCRGNDTEARTIVVIRPIKYQSGASEDDRAAETPRATASSHASSSSSSSGRSIVARRLDEYCDDRVSKSVSMEGVAEHSPSSSWRKLALRSFSCVCASNITSWTSI